MSPHHKHLHLLVYSFILNKGRIPCQVVIHINKYWLISNSSEVENFPVALKTLSILYRSTYLVIQTSVHEPMPLIS